MKYKVGDEFISLVKNELRGVEVGDVLKIYHIDYSLNNPYQLRCGANNPWWFSDLSINMFTLPVDKVTDKDLFSAKLMGRYPNYPNYILDHSNGEWSVRNDISKKMVGDKDHWKKIYIFGCA